MTIKVFALTVIVMFVFGCDDGNESTSNTSAWGNTCTSDKDCSGSTQSCIKLTADDQGYCAPSCGQLDEEDIACTDLFGGEEYCGAQRDSVNYCIIYCENNSDCPDGTVCEMAEVWDTYQNSCTGKSS